jgi:hypothetical protein
MALSTLMVTLISRHARRGSLPDRSAIMGQVSLPPPLSDLMNPVLLVPRGAGSRSIVT